MGNVDQSAVDNPLVECVPNFSEGRNRETIERLCSVIARTETACVLDTHVDPDHNRSVITFVAHPAHVVAAAVNAVALAAELIDMRVQHAGSWHRGDRLRQSLNRFGLAAFAEVWYTLNDASHQ